MHILVSLYVQPSSNFVWLSNMDMVMHSLPGLTVSREIIAFSCFARSRTSAFAFDIILWKIILASPGTFAWVKLLLSSVDLFHTTFS